jgi:hypothetical protein
LNTCRLSQPTASWVTTMVSSWRKSLSPTQAPATCAMASSPVNSTTCSLRVSRPLKVRVNDLKALAVPRRAKQAVKARPSARGPRTGGFWRSEPSAY